MNDKTICYCKGVTEKTIVEAIRDGSTTLKQIQDSTSACTGNRCKEFNPSGCCCSDDILDLIEKETGSRPLSKCCYD
ncbi:MAG: (2Fe-2S)-binding protein [Deltaproteobacteria bacterium]|nr:(2Fe-2S)-binding protein [Deltaproteobacteria bacterium]